MQLDKDKILARELGRLGGPGASLVARLLPNDVLELTLETHSPPERVLDVAFTILSQEGQIIQDHRSDPDQPAICAVMGSGFWALNPALIQVQVVSTTDKGTRWSIIGTAKEGLIKQHAGEQAAKRIADLMTQALADPCVST